MAGQRTSAVPFDRPTPLEALLERAVREPDRVALIADDERWTCGGLAEESARLANGFRARGIQAGDRIALHMTNRTELVLAYLACWRVGAIAVPLNTRYKTPELFAMIERVRPVLYLGEAHLYGAVKSIGEDLLPAKGRFVAGLGSPIGDVQFWNVLLASDLETNASSEPVVPRAPAVLLATSGTTGPSKLVVWTERTLAAFARGALQLGMGEKDILLLNLPLMHASGVSFLSSCLLSGTVIVAVSSVDPDRLLDIVEEQRCTTLAAPPFLCSALAQSQYARARDLSSLRLCFTGADVCTTAIERAFEDAIGCPLPSFWASTEDARAMTVYAEPGNFIRPLPDTEIRVVNEVGTPQTAEEGGEMLVRSPTTASGYWVGPGQVDPLPDGWFHTGDLVRLEADGRWRFLGRLKDLIVRGGSNISPIEVEEALRHQPGVADAAVVGMPDPELGQRVGAALVLAVDTTDQAVPGIIAGVRRELADYKVPERIAVVDLIPRSALTKVDRRATVAMVTAEGKPV